MRRLVDMTLEEMLKDIKERVDILEDEIKNSKDVDKNTDNIPDYTTSIEIKFNSMSKAREFIRGCKDGKYPDFTILRVFNC